MATARTRRTPVPAVEPTDDVAPLVEDAAPAPAPVPVPAPVVVVLDGAQIATAVATVAAEAEAAVEPEAEVPPTRLVVARHEGLGVHAVLTRASLRRWEGWAAVADLPDSEPAVLPAKYQTPAV